MAKIAASLFHSAGKIERSMSMSRLAHRALPEEVISLRQKFQVASDQNRDFSGSEERGSDSSTKDTEGTSTLFLPDIQLIWKASTDSIYFSFFGKYLSVNNCVHLQSYLSHLGKNKSNYLLTSLFQIALLH